MVTSLPSRPARAEMLVSRAAANVGMAAEARASVKMSFIVVLDEMLDVDLV